MPSPTPPWEPPRSPSRRRGAGSPPERVTMKVVSPTFSPRGTGGGPLHALPHPPLGTPSFPFAPTRRWLTTRAGDNEGGLADIFPQGDGGRAITCPPPPPPGNPLVPLRADAALAHHPSG